MRRRLYEAQAMSYTIICSGMAYLYYFETGIC